MEEVDKHFLFMFVVFGVASCDFASPIDGKPEGFELFSHGVDIFVSPVFGVDVSFDGGIFCG